MVIIMPLFKALPLVVTCLLAGCATPTARVFEDYPPRTDYEAVEILRDIPTRPYLIIAEVELRAASEKTLKKKAASYGADAIYVTSYGQTSGTLKNELRNSDEDTGNRNNREYICTVIKYK